METDSFELTFLSQSPGETRKIGKALGEAIGPGTVIAFFGNLGSGKTCFIQGLGKGLDVPEDLYIVSPSFTLVNDYPGRYPLFHIDLYRLEGPDDFESIGLFEILQNDDVVVAVEWAERIDSWKTTDHISVHIEYKNPENNPDARSIRIAGFGPPCIEIMKRMAE